MTTTTSMTTVLQEMFNRLPDMGWFATADSIGAGYIDHNAMFANSRYGVDKYAGRWMWLYTLTGNDRVKPAGDLDTTLGRLAHTNADVYTGTATALSPALYALSGIHPDIVLAATTRGHARRSSRTMQPLITFVDADMRLSTALNWDGTSNGSAVSNCTATKITTDAYEGPRSLSLVFSAAGFDRGPKMKVYPGQVIKTYVRLKTTASTISFGIWDTTNAALITGTTPTYTGRDFGVLWRQDIVPAGCYEVQVQLNAAAACTVIADCYYGPYIFGRKRIVLPVDLDEDWRVRLVRLTEYMNLPGMANGYDAWSRGWSGDLLPARQGETGDYTFEINRQDVNPYSISFDEPIETYLQNGPIDLATERYTNASETFAVPSDTTVLGREEIADFAIHELAKVMTRFYAKNDPGWTATLQEYALKTAIQNIVRPAQARAEPGHNQKVRMNI